MICFHLALCKTCQAAVFYETEKDQELNLPASMAEFRLKSLLLLQSTEPYLDGWLR